MNKIFKFTSDYFHYELVGSGRAKRVKLKFVFRDVAFDYFKDLLNIFPKVSFQQYLHAVSPYWVATIIYLGNSYVFYLADSEYKRFLHYCLNNDVPYEEIDLERKIKEKGVQNE